MQRAPIIEVGCSENSTECALRESETTLPERGETSMDFTEFMVLEGRWAGVEKFALIQSLSRVEIVNKKTRALALNN